MDGGDKADFDILCHTGKRFVFDARTVNVLCPTGLSHHASAEKHCETLENQKNRHYVPLFVNVFKPFVVALTGATTTASARALGLVTHEVAKSVSGTLDWEAARWREDALHRIAVAVVRLTTVIATRTVQPPGLVGRPGASPFVASPVSACL